MFLRELYLTGNPCVEFEGYRDYVIATLPQLERLDGLEIEKSERIKAVQSYTKLKKTIDIQESAYFLKRVSISAPISFILRVSTSDVPHQVNITTYNFQGNV